VIAAILFGLFFLCLAFVVGFVMGEETATRRSDRERAGWSAKW
jgi:hypothetical protein